MELILKRDITLAFRALGLKSGMTAIVHTSLKSIGYVCGGARTVIESLFEVLTADGTIMMPTQSWKNLDPLQGVHDDVPRDQWQILRDNLPPYDPLLTPTNTMGATAEMFRHWRGTIRSNHPARSFAANGKNAAYLVENHSLTDIFGETSPLSKLYNLDGYVLLIGVGYDKNTSLHLADVRADYPSKHTEIQHSAILENGRRVWKEYETLYVDGHDFVEIGNAFEANFPVPKVRLGNATLRLIRQRQLVDFAVDWIERNRDI